MNRLKDYILIVLFCCVSLTLAAQKERSLVREGNQRYIEGKWDEAEKEYNEALNIKNNLPEGVFNLGDVAYQKQDYQKAAEQFQTAALLATDNQQRAKAYHNMGNSYLKAGQLEKSIEAYKNALRMNPADMDTKYNLAYAQQMLKKNPQQQQQNQENQDEKNKEKQEQNQQNQNQDQQSKEQQQKEGEQKEQNQQEQQAKEEKGEEKDAQQQQGQPRQAQLSKEDAQRLLEALMQEEKKVQQQLINKKLPPEKKTTEKDW